MFVKIETCKRLYIVDSLRRRYKMKVKKSILMVTMLFLTGISLFFIYNNQALKIQVQELELEMVQVEQTFNDDLVDRYLTQLAETDEPLFTSYSAWKEAEEFVAYFSEDSDGKFEEDWGFFLVMEAKRNDIDPLLVYELLKVETGGRFDPELIGPETRYGHAYGLAQFMENTAPWIAEMAGLDYKKGKLFDPFYSIQLSVTYLDFLYHYYEDWDHALTAYHRGMYGLEQYINENGHARSWYAAEIQENAENSELLVYE